jgi:hypothetical protein
VAAGGADELGAAGEVEDGAAFGVELEDPPELQAASPSASTAPAAAAAIDPGFIEYFPVL